jgi:hypothetical protein
MQRQKAIGVQGGDGMRGSLTAAAVFLVAMIGSGVAALAQDAPAGSTLPITISLTPRVWYVTDNENLLSNFQTVTQPGNPFTGILQATKTQVSYPLGGLTLEAAPKDWSQVSFLLTGLYGRGDQSGQLVEAIPAPQLNGILRLPNGALVPSSLPLGEVELGNFVRHFSRYDIEALARYRQNANFSFVGGFRVISYKNDFNGAAPTIPISVQSTLNYYLAEAGVALAAPISDSGRHSVFGGATLGIGEFDLSSNPKNAALEFGGPSTSGFAATLDINVGYQYAIASFVALNARYRAVVFGRSGIQGGFGQSVTVLHGPEIGVTLRF